MLRKLLILFLLLWVGFCFIANAWPHPLATVTATATATVVEDLTITSEEPLNFGFITPSPQGGTVTVSPDNQRSETGGVRTSSSFTRAEFTVRGMAGHSYTIHTPPSLTFSVKENDDESSQLLHELIVSHFITYSTTSGETAAAGKLAQNGQDRIYLGATLMVPAGAAPGVYSGWVPVTVSY